MGRSRRALPEHGGRKLTNLYHLSGLVQRLKKLEPEFREEQPGNSRHRLVADIADAPRKRALLQSPAIW